MHLLGGDQVALGKDADLLRVLAMRAVKLGCHPLVATADGLASIDEHGDDVNVFKRLERRGVQLLAKRIVGLVKARSVHDDHLHIIASVDRAETMAGGLGGVGSDGDLLAHDSVEQRRLSRVGSADQRDEAGFEALARRGRGMSEVCVEVHKTPRFKRLITMPKRP